MKNNFLLSEKELSGITAYFEKVKEGISSNV